MNNDKDFINDPLFKDLRIFAAKESGPENMPAELFTAFRNAQVKRVRSKWTGRTVIGLVGAAIALPTLSYAHVLPKPVENVVNKVTHFVSAPVRVVASVISNDPLPTPSQSPIPTSSPESPLPTNTTNNEGNTPITPPVPPATKHSDDKSGVGKSESRTESGKSENSESKSEVESTGTGKVEEVESGSNSASSSPSIGSGEGKTESKSSESGKSGEKESD